MFPASINRPNLKFHFLPPRVRRKKPASYGQIAETSFRIYNWALLRRIKNNPNEIPEIKIFIHENSLKKARNRKISPMTSNKTTKTSRIFSLINLRNFFILNFSTSQTSCFSLITYSIRYFFLSYSLSRIIYIYWISVTLTFNHTNIF